MSLRCSCHCTVSNKKCLSLPQMPLTTCLNVACNGCCAKQRHPSSSQRLTSPPSVQCNGQSTAQKSKLAYPLAQIHALNCSRVSSCSPHLRSISLFFSPHSLPSPVSPSACISLSLSQFTPFPPPIIQSSSDGYCVSSGGECRERRGQGIRLACFTIGMRLSVSNDALIISTLALGFLTE